MENYFLFITDKTTGEPIQNIDEWMELHNLDDIVEQAVLSEKHELDVDNCHVNLLEFEVEDSFLEFLDTLTPLPGLIWLAPIDMSEEELEDILPTDNMVC